ncbi:hypothetical protein TMatcc_002005 [Talaromyces marneffei ATCC 18224]
MPVSSSTPLTIDSALASRSGFEGVGSETETLADISFLARFFFEDLVSVCVGRWLLMAADMVNDGVCVEKCRVQPWEFDRRVRQQPEVGLKEAGESWKVGWGVTEEKKSMEATGFKAGGCPVWALRTRRVSLSFSLNGSTAYGLGEHDLYSIAQVLLMLVDLTT